MDRHQAPSGEPLDQPPSPNRRGGLAVLTAIVLAALLLRLLYLRQIESIPFFYGLISDAQRYDEWARTIARGDWWGDQPFYQAPLYPYVLALIKVAATDDPLATRVVQAVLGSLACGLIGLAGWGFISRRTGLWAAAILALYPPAIFFDGLIQKTSLGQFLGAGLLALLAWTHVRPSRAKPPAIGALLGLYALTRENALALAPVVGLWLWVGFPSQTARRRGQYVILLLAGLAFVLLPVGLRNRSLGGEFSLTTFQTGPNFYIGNHPDATGRYRPLVRGHETPQFEQRDATELAEQAVGHSLSPGQVSAYWMGQARQFIRAQPLRWLRLMGTKCLLVWNAYEVPDAESYYIYAEWSWLLGTLGGFMHFGVLLPLAVGGVALTWSHRRELWLLYALALVMAAAVVVFYVLARYRYPLVPILALFAGAAVSEVLRTWHGGTYRHLMAAALIALGTAVVCNLPINPERQLNAMAWGNLGGTLARQGHSDRAVLFFEKAVEGAPEAAEMRYNLGLAYARQQRFHDAVSQFQTAVQLEPTLIEVDYQLAVALERLGRTREALHHYHRALERNRSDTDARAAVERLTGRD